jgi:hypothetical protein
MRKPGIDGQEDNRQQDILDLNELVPRRRRGWNQYSRHHGRHHDYRQDCDSIGHKTNQGPSGYGRLNRSRVGCRHGQPFIALAEPTAQYARTARSAKPLAKVFWFFSSEKNAFLA